MEEQIKEIIGDYGWMFFAGFILLMFKSTLLSIIEGLKVFLGNDLNTDDVINLDGKPARVVRVGIWKTTFFVYDVTCSDGKPIVSGGCKTSIQNDMIKQYKIEKPLPMLDLTRWINCKEKENGKR